MSRYVKNTKKIPHLLVFVFILFFASNLIKLQVTGRLFQVFTNKNYYSLCSLCFIFLFPSESEMLLVKFVFILISDETYLHIIIALLLHLFTCFELN